MKECEIKLSLKGLDCANCAGKIEKKVNEFEEVQEANLNFAVGFILIKIYNASDSEKVKQKVKDLVKSLEPHVVVSEYKKMQISKTNKNVKMKTNINHKDAEKIREIEEKETKQSNLFIENMPLFIGIFIYIISAIFLQDKSYGVIGFLASFVLVGKEVVVKAVKNILKGEIFDENFLMTVATVGAFAIKQYPEAVAVMIFYEIGEMFQDYAVQKSRKSISSLMDIKPEFANLIAEDKETKVSPEQVKVNDIIIVKPGERVPLDGIVIEGSASVDTSALTGESVPKTISTDDEILSGFINNNGVIKVKVTKAFAESTVTRILELVENASNKKAKTEKFITKFAKIYTPVVVSLAVLLAVVPTFIFGFSTFSDWLYRALVFLVVSCPCALVISVPLGLFAGIGGASKKGVLIKGGNYLELLKDVDTIVFDKTGTLTKGTFNVVKVQTNNIKEEELIKIAAYGENYSNHPIAQSIIKFYGKKIDTSVIENYKEISGNGIEVTINGDKVLLGNTKLMNANNIKYASEDTIGTIVYVAVNGEFKGYIIIADEIKETSKEAIRSLKNYGVRKTVMLTGDNKNAGKKVADELGLDEVYAELLPQDKVEQLEKLINDKNNHGKLVFVGDGINDAPVLARADIGVAMGGIGSDAAIEAADVVLMRDDPLALLEAIKVSKKTIGILWQNIIFALIIKIGVLVLSTFGLANMWLGVFADVGVTLIAVINSMRALR